MSPSKPPADADSPAPTVTLTSGTGPTHMPQLPVTASPTPTVSSPTTTTESPTQFPFRQREPTPGERPTSLGAPPAENGDETLSGAAIGGIALVGVAILAVAGIVVSNLFECGDKRHRRHDYGTSDLEMTEEGTWQNRSPLTGSGDDHLI